MQQHGRIALDGGAEIAYATVGAGRPLVFVDGWLGHLDLSWRLTGQRTFLEALSAGRRLVRYDRLGCGLSSGTPPRPTLAGELEQLDAVVATLGPDPIDIVGSSLGAAVAAAWTAAHPGRVRRLVLYGGWAQGSKIAAPAVRDHMLGLVGSHWGLGADVLTEIFAPDAQAPLRAALGRYQRASSSAETARSLLRLGYELDIRDVLRDIDAPTLVVHRAHDRAAPLAEAEAVAAAIPDAELVVLPGRSHLPYVGDADALVREIRRFLGLRSLRRAADGLTARQREVARLVSDGLTNREIAARLGIDERSAEGHVERIRLRLGLRSRAQIAAWAATRRDPEVG